MRRLLTELQRLGELGAAIERQPVPPRRRRNGGPLQLQELAPGVWGLPGSRAPSSSSSGRRLPGRLGELSDTHDRVTAAFRQLGRELEGACRK